jgi:hypothetical protein
MKRAEFLKVMGAGTLVALAGSAVTACKSSSTTPSNPDSHTFTSTGPSDNSSGHTHTITIQKTEVETPPAGGISRETSTNGHSHTFTMTAANLADVKAGTAVTVTTSNTSGHTHDFAISKWY